MKCPNCNQDSLSKDRMYWADIKSPAKCSNCGQENYIKGTWSKLYWSIQFYGLAIFFLPFLSFYYYGVKGCILALTLSFGLGILLRFFEIKFLLPIKVTEKDLERKKLLGKTGVILSLLLVLAFFIKFAIDISN